MAGITRATAQLFATTGLTPSGGFAGAANGNVTTEAGSSNTLANIQTASWAAGWLAATLGSSKFPAIEDMNAVTNVLTTQIAYILERGIPEYDAGTTYNANDIVRAIGVTQLYFSVGNANIGNAVTNATYWTPAIDLAGTGLLKAANNLSDLGTLATALTNLGFSVSLASNGYIKIPTPGAHPLIIQWGNASGAGTSGSNYSLPITFPNNFYVATLAHEQNLGSTIVTISYVPTSTSQIGITASSNGSTVSYIAIGD